MKAEAALNLTELLDNLVTPQSDKLNQAQRVFHGRGHAYQGLNHITIDWLKPLLFITLFMPVNESELTELVKRLLERFDQCSSVQVQYRHQANWVVDCLYGEKIQKLVIEESDLLYQLEIKSGANTGLFLDMKNGRDWVAANAHQKRVLNLFAYTCGFSVAAAAGGATSVFNIDMSSPFLNTGRENHRLNKQSLDSIRFDKLHILKSFGRIKKPAPYDLIICDPPTFQKGSFDISRDYPKLIRRLIDFISTDGMLMLCINSPHIGALTGKEFLLNSMQENAPEFRLVNEIKPPKVYKETQGKGVKVLIFAHNAK